MKTNRLIAGGVALALVAALVGLAVVAGRDGSGDPAVLPVFGAGGGAAAESMAADDTAGMRMAGPIEYRASGKLPGLDDEADAWTVPAAEVTAARVAELAKALDVAGEPERTEYGWTVGTDRRRLDVQDVAGTPWSLYESMPEPMVAEAEARRAEEAVVSAPDCAADACDQPMEAQRPADLPSKAEAEELARRLFTELGVGEAAIRVDDAVTQWAVSADPVIGGLPTIGLTTSVSIGSKGVVQYANGWLGSFTKGDRYPLIGTAAGLEKLGDNEMRTLMVDPAIGAADCLDCPDVEPIVVEITGVRLGLQLYSTYEQGAEGHLVPSYLFSTADGGEIPVIALADEFLAEQPQPQPEPAVEEPATEPDAPVSSGGGECVGTGDGEVSAEVCVTSAPAGEPVLVTVIAKGSVRDDCGSPTVDFGDGSDIPVCDIGCESLPTEPVELERTFEHVYAESGNYDAVVRFWGCGTDMGTEQLSVPILVRVEG